MSKALTVEQIDAALDGVYRERDRVLAQPHEPERCDQLAELADLEASWWETFSEHSRSRVHWRAALAARQHALDVARRWRTRADILRGQRALEVVPPGVGEAA